MELSAFSEAGYRISELLRERKRFTIDDLAEIGKKLPVPEEEILSVMMKLDRTSNLEISAFSACTGKRISWKRRQKENESFPVTDVIRDGETYKMLLIFRKNAFDFLLKLDGCLMTLKLLRRSIVRKKRLEKEIEYLRFDIEKSKQELLKECPFFSLNEDEQRQIRKIKRKKEKLLLYLKQTKSLTKGA